MDLRFSIAMMMAMTVVQFSMAADELGVPKSDLGTVTVGTSDWPWWRGPNRNGIASADQKPPLKWSETENVLWKAPVPGRGHGSPIVVGDQIFLATANAKDETQSVLCF